MKKICLVFRDNEERTAAYSKGLALMRIQPDNAIFLEDVKPFTETINQMLDSPFSEDFIITVDADCLIGENLRPFLEFNESTGSEKFSPLRIEIPTVGK